MNTNNEAERNYEKTKQWIGYLPRHKSSTKTYSDLGFRCGLEIHQQLKTQKKLFCRCPGGIYHKKDDYNAEIIRHMRPTLSELGEYDGTALMEFKTRKNITYRIKNETACTYEIDDTPPFPLNREALDIAIEIGLLLKTSTVGELHITRKQYLDGSIPTGFQRTAIVGIEGSIPFGKRDIKIIQLSIEEDSCREVSDIGHERIYTTDRLGMPLIEMVTYPDMNTPEEAAEVAHYLRFLARSTGKVRTGIGAAREDVNVSITGGTRVEIKGVAHISWIPELTHIEAFRQKALLEIKKELLNRTSKENWKINKIDITSELIINQIPSLKDKVDQGSHIMIINLPDFKDLLSYFTQPGQSFSNELMDRLKVIACLEKPNMTHSEDLAPQFDNFDFSPIKKLLNSKDNDAQVILWGPEEDMKTAWETIEERCLLAFDGVPNETRKSFKDGTTIFERVLPGPDRMYPDTDSAPIPIKETQIQKIMEHLPSDIDTRKKQLEKWNIPTDTYTYILKKDLFPLIERIVKDFNEPPAFVGTLIGHHFKNIERDITPSSPYDIWKIHYLFENLNKRGLKRDIMKELLSTSYQYPNMDFESLLITIEYKDISEKEIISNIPILKDKFKEIRTSEDQMAMSLWIMGELRPMALGSIELKKLREIVDGGNHE
jgi:glutamyl-tRNA(Gln) amidotransferase subunit E